MSEEKPLRIVSFGANLVCKLPFTVGTTVNEDGTTTITVKPRSEFIGMALGERQPTDPTASPEDDIFTPEEIRAQGPEVRAAQEAALRDAPEDDEHMDLAIARSILKEINEDPTQVVRGTELDKALRELEGPTSSEEETKTPPAPPHE